MAEDRNNLLPKCSIKVILQNKDFTERNLQIEFYQQIISGQEAE